MSNEKFNMSMRKFLKQVGVTSQQQLEIASGQIADGESEMKVKMVLTIEGSDFTHQVDGVIELD